MFNGAKASPGLGLLISMIAGFSLNNHDLSLYIIIRWEGKALRVNMVMIFNYGEKTRCAKHGL